MIDIVQMAYIFAVLVGWLGFLSWKLWGYRKAIIQLQRDLIDPGGILDELTKP